jgi:hypothetical protein
MLLKVKHNNLKTNKGKIKVVSSKTTKRDKLLVRCNQNKARPLKSLINEVLSMKHLKPRESESRRALHSELSNPGI